MKKSLLTIAALAVLTLPAMADAAQGRPGGYASVFLGMSMMKDADVTSNGFDTNNLPATFNDEIEFDPGVYVGGTLGYDFGGIRMEGELSYRQNDMDSINDRDSGSSYGSVDGDVGVFAVMANAFVDLRNDSPITPYIGGGIGVATVYLSDTENSSNFFYTEDDDSVFAYQIGGGVGIALNRQTTLDLGYRYFGTETASFDNVGFEPTKFDTESHNFAVGLRLRF